MYIFTRGPGSVISPLFLVQHPAMLGLNPGEGHQPTVIGVDPYGFLNFSGIGTVGSWMWGGFGAIPTNVGVPENEKSRVYTLYIVGPVGIYR